MSTTQSSDPNERVEHPRWYNGHPSGIECIEIIEHLPCNLANAVKYIWRYGLKQSSDPIRDLRSADWYVRREISRIDRFDLEDEPKPRADPVWRKLAARIVHVQGDQDGLLADCLYALLQDDLPGLLNRLEREVANLREKGCAAL